MTDRAMSTDVFPVLPAPGFAPQKFWRCARSWWQRLLRLSGRTQRRLRLCESLPLGERRFVAVIEFEQSRFLVGGTPTSLVLLSRLENIAGEEPAPASSADIAMRGKDLR